MGDTKMIIRFNANYPSLGMSKALSSVIEGSHSWSADEVESIINQAMALLNERRKSFTQYELTKLRALLGLAKEAA
jgi:hypothetical protein